MPSADLSRSLCPPTAHPRDEEEGGRRREEGRPAALSALALSRRSNGASRPRQTSKTSKQKRGKRRWHEQHGTEINTPETPAITIERPVVCFSLTMGSIGSARTVAKSKVAVKKDASEVGTITEDEAVDKRLPRRQVLDGQTSGARQACGGEIPPRVSAFGPRPNPEGRNLPHRLFLIRSFETQLVQWQRTGKDCLTPSWRRTQRCGCRVAAARSSTLADYPPPSIRRAFVRRLLGNRCHQVQHQINQAIRRTAGQGEDLSKRGRRDSAVCCSAFAELRQAL